MNSGQTSVPSVFCSRIRPSGVDIDIPHQNGSDENDDGNREDPYPAIECHRHYSVDQWKGFRDSIENDSLDKAEMKWYSS